MDKPENTSKISVRQDLCGLLFAGTYVINIAAMLLKGLGGMPQNSTWYIYLLGFMAMCGYVILSSLSSNSVAEVFSNSQFCLTVVFTLIMPELITDTQETLLYYRITIEVCMMLTVLSIYLWTMLMHNCEFDNCTIRWLVFMPMPYLAKLAEYNALLEHINGGVNTMVERTVGSDIFIWFSCIIMAICAQGCWKMCHARCFSLESTDYSTPSWSPLNRYTISYAVALVVIYFMK